MDTKTENSEQEERKAAEILQIFGSKLQRLADQQVMLRAPLEERWEEDLRAYLGVNAPGEKERLENASKSTISVNITRNKTNAAEARLADILFPTDDKNWGIRPTPRPDMDEEQAKAAAEEMEKDIDDQLNEAGYNEICRELIHSATVYGTGILKAPVIVGQVKKKWQMQGDVAILEMVEDIQPGAEVVDIWDFFPDMSARNVDEAEFFFERRLMTAAKMREYAKRPGVIRSQMQLAMAGGAKSAPAPGDIAVREYAGVAANNETRYELWEYTGTIDKEELSSAGIDVDNDDMLDIKTGVVTFCNGVVVKVELNPMDTDEHPYSIFCWERDPGNIFGIGVPRIMRESAKVMKAAWRMALDNSGICAGPQIVIDQNCVKPADGVWDVVARKIWLKDDENIPMNAAFATFNFNSHQAELMDLFTRARQLADEETSLPLIAQGEQTNAVTHTARGMSMLMSSANVVLRRVVRDFDDYITRPIIGRMYDWNMQYGENAKAKGDFKVDARGSSALAEQAAAEQGIQEVFQLIDHPRLGPKLDADKTLKLLLRAKRVDPDKVVTKEEPQPQDPMNSLEGKKIQIDLGRLELDEKRLNLDTELRHMELALKNDLTLAQLDAKLAAEREKVKATRDIAAVKELSAQNEMQLKRDVGQGI